MQTQPVPLERVVFLCSEKNTYKSQTAKTCANIDLLLGNRFFMDFKEREKDGGKNKIPQLPPDVFLTMEKYLYDADTGGSTNSDGVLALDLLPGEKEFSTFAERYQFAWGTKGLDAIMFYAKIAAGATSP